MMKEELNQMKNKWTRLIAAVLTLAMAFSICAMPASASIYDQNTWAFGGDTGNTAEGCMWFSEAFCREVTIEGWDENEDGKMTEDALTAVMLIMKMGMKEAAAEEDSNTLFYEGTLPSNAYVGLSKAKNSNIYWYTKEAITGIDDNATDQAVDWSTGTLTYTVGGVQKKVQAINTLSGSASNTLSKDTNSSGGSSNSIGTVVLLAGGAVVVGAVVYLFTHPAVVQKIKNFFTGNSAAEQPVQTVEASNEAAAVNEADVNESATENAVELPAEAEQAA
jgi:hypothetical protein